MIKEIYLAGGCFWGMQGYFKQIDGVIETKVGYANGNGTDTNYKIVKKTNHAETIYIKYDEDIVTLNTLLKHYFRVIDPTSLNKQGADFGTQYRTGIYYIDNFDLNIINSFIKAEQEKYIDKIVVEVEKLKNFVPAEEYHQDYLDKNPFGYCHIDLNLAKKPIE